MDSETEIFKNLGTNNQRTDNTTNNSEKEDQSGKFLANQEAVFRLIVKMIILAIGGKTEKSVSNADAKCWIDHTKLRF